MTEYVTAAKIEGVQSGFQGFMTLCFWLWGGFGLLFNGVSFLGLTGNIGVGTSSYLTASISLWIGGTVFFGLATLIAPGGYEFKRLA
jgi:hypothetical protein